MPPKRLLSAIILQHIPFVCIFFPLLSISRETSMLVSRTFYLINVETLTPKKPYYFWFILKASLPSLTAMLLQYSLQEVWDLELRKMDNKPGFHYH